MILLHCWDNWDAIRFTKQRIGPTQVKDLFNFLHTTWKITKSIFLELMGKKDNSRLKLYTL